MSSKTSIEEFETFSEVLDALPGMNGDMISFLSANVDHLAALSTGDYMRLTQRLSELNVSSETVGILSAEIRQAKRKKSNRPKDTDAGDRAGRGEQKHWSDGLWSIDDLLAHEFPEPTWTIPDLLPTGLGVFGGRPKMGKSFLALQLAVSVATGGKFLGRDANKGNVLYIALEDPERRIQDRVQKQYRETGANMDVRFEWEPLHEQGGTDLYAAVNERNYSLVIIDTISRALGRADQMDLADMNVTIGALQRLAIEKDITLLLVDHHRKSGGMVGDVIDDIMGSTSKAAVADTVWGIYRERGKKDATLKVSGREINEQEFAIAFDDDLSCWQFLGDAQDYVQGERQREILDAVGDMGQATHREIMDATGQDRGNSFRRIQDLLHSGKLRRIDGPPVRYALPEKEG